MNEINQLLLNNKKWSEKIRKADPDFFPTLERQQAPTYMWIGCSDSRVPANEIVGMLPGEVFVHRNVANVVVNSDLNCLSSIQFAVEVLKVRHIIVTGHYGCGGVRAALGADQFGLIDNWLRHIKDIYAQHQEEVDAITDMNERVNRMCELNVKHQVRHVCHTGIVQNAWSRGQPLSVHGWCYGLSDGLLKDLQVTQSGPEQLGSVYTYIGQ
ncbi:Carbonic anhydrase [Hahella chejuensis KCTC 2396]|uniref:Carbonic anhydrase n=1 Tax=Hahella chejuensis (strain KCTC 2396) TaxID=349521 RepID=Q2SCN2_HAHCH|nr:carbonate dehydratase [Hahella chejuensis]ABC31592.1 Carbonic anhydrase [Hahella chejuensis KCTC 2396]